MSTRPETTLFLLTSIDGKISTGSSDSMDVDRDYPKIDGLKEGLGQYYDLEMETDLFSLNTGRVFAKIGMNERTDDPEKSPVSFIVVDNKPHLNNQGVSYLAKKSNILFIITTNKEHPAFALKSIHSNINIILYEKAIDFTDALRKLREDYGIEKLTIQSGGTLNATFVREGLIDRVLIVVAPALIGGRNTASLMDGESLHTSDELSKIKTFELVQAKPLKNSYLLLEYRIHD